MLRAALEPVATAARRLQWSKDRPWRTRSHVWGEQGSPTIDLHDLSVRLALETTERALAVSGELRSGAVVWVTGKGRHSIGGRSPLREAVTEALSLAAEEQGWRIRPGAPGRLVLVMDEELATDAASGRIGGLAWGVIALFVLATLYALWKALSQ